MYNETIIFTDMPLAMDCVADKIKSATANVHTETEALMMPMLANMRSLTDYGSLLAMFYGFFTPLHQLCVQQLSEDDLPDIAQRNHANAISKDLDATGLQTQPQLCNQLPAIQNKGAAFGALYVMEGATLGGRMIAKMLRGHSQLALTDQQLHFFNGYGTATGEMWLRFRTALNQQPQEQQILATAAETFTLFKNWIQHCAHAADHCKK